MMGCWASGVGQPPASRSCHLEGQQPCPRQASPGPPAPRERAAGHLGITPQTAKVLKVFLEDPTHVLPFEQINEGFELMRRTGLSSGTVYLMLARMEEAGLLTSGKEDIDPRSEGRPARRHYTISGAAAAAVRVQLAALSEQYRPPVPAITRLRAQGGTA